jgi:hypothetical protein
MMAMKDEDKNKKFSVAEELDKLNKLFAKRYTDEDMEMAKIRSTSPPIVDDWGQEKNNYRNQKCYYSNNRYRNDNRYRRDRSRSPPHYYNKYR